MSAACAPATATSPAAVRGEDFSPSSSQPPYVVVGGIDLLGRCSPWKVPLAPLTVRPFRCLSLSPRHRNDRKGRPWDAPLRRTPTLTHMFRQATTKRHFEHSAVQFSAGCCLNNTSLKAAIRRSLTLSSAFDLPSNILKLNKNNGQTDFRHAPHLDRRVSANGAFGSNAMKAGRAVQHF